MKKKTLTHYNHLDGKTYTEKQLLKFRFFCYTNGLYFNTMPEYNAALTQYFTN